MNQEKIMKARMITAYVIGGLALAVMFVFMSLYINETYKTKESYRNQYKENMSLAKEEIDVIIEKGIDYDVHYNMILSDLGTARSMIFLIEDYSYEQKNTLNEFHYCFVKYPLQMSEKLQESSEAIGDVLDNLDKGYEEMRDIVDSVDKKGF